MYVLQFYQFHPIIEEELFSVKEWFYEKCVENELKGLILIATEGINLSVSGSKLALIRFLNECYQAPYPLKKETRVRIMETEVEAYKKLVVKIKKQIIPFPVEVDLKLNQNRYIKPEDFHQLMLNDQALPVDTRNDYEWLVGAFRNAEKFPITKFRNLPEQISWFRDIYEKNHNHKKKKIVLYCTGGIRCEKVTPFLVLQGFDVYQLEGGILDYFQTIHHEQEHFWEGECFVFDERYTILPNFKKGNTKACIMCGQPIVKQKCVHCGNIQIA
ncbi:MAG: rhodanese-like domain-containing protein [Leptospiraceae bacterium]|nr:rhodanese-like domain-containing protein [Leptospiraceae bacterium]MDW7975119.1 rhodanese-like domain-containing protein [Leptospiraceae bacterium]